MRERGQGELRRVFKCDPFFEATSAGEKRIELSVICDRIGCDAKRFAQAETQPVGNCGGLKLRARGIAYTAAKIPAKFTKRSRFANVVFTHTNAE
jgi:hypothetical protein